MALRVPEMCFWLAETRKNFKHLRSIHVFDLVLNYCSDIVEVNWLRLLFYFIQLMDMVTSAIRRRFFIFVSGFSLKFSRIELSQKRLQLKTKTFSTRTTWGDICMNCSIGFFWWYQKFAIVSLRVFFVCSLKMLVLFSHRIS